MTVNKRFAEKATPSLRVLVFGGTGTAGRGAVRALVAAGHEVTCFARPAAAALSGVSMIRGALSEASCVDFRGFDAVLTCLASRTGTPKDAWAVDYKAHSEILKAAQAGGVKQFVLLSAICVQKPRLAFQHAKLAFEAELQASGLVFSIVRPTAFFKSLSGQIDRVKAGKPFLVFGNGALTACKPISDDDLGAFIARCLVERDLQNRVLPIGGPGPAITPLDQADALFRMLGKEPKIKHVPVALLSIIQKGLGLFGAVVPTLAAKSELARIGSYYATESMLLWDEDREVYDADITPETGSDTLFDHYRAILDGQATTQRSEHSVY